MGIKDTIKNIGKRFKESEKRRTQAQLKQNALTLQRLRKQRIKQEGLSKQQTLINKERARIAKAQAIRNPPQSKDTRRKTLFDDAELFEDKDDFFGGGLF